MISEWIITVNEAGKCQPKKEKRIHAKLIRFRKKNIQKKRFKANNKDLIIFLLFSLTATLTLPIGLPLFAPQRRLGLDQSRANLLLERRGEARRRGVQRQRRPSSSGRRSRIGQCRLLLLKGAVARVGSQPVRPVPRQQFGGGRLLRGGASYSCDAVRGRRRRVVRMRILRQGRRVKIDARRRMALKSEDMARGGGATAGAGAHPPRVRRTAQRKRKGAGQRLDAGARLATALCNTSKSHLSRFPRFCFFFSFFFLLFRSILSITAPV